MRINLWKFLNRFLNRFRKRFLRRIYEKSNKLMKRNRKDSISSISNFRRNRPQSQWLWRKNDQRLLIISKLRRNKERKKEWWERSKERKMRKGGEKSTLKTCDFEKLRIQSLFIKSLKRITLKKLNFQVFRVSSKSFKRFEIGP